MWRPALRALLAAPAAADTVIAAHTLRAQSVIGADDLSSITAAVPGALTDPAQAIGREARVALQLARAIDRLDYPRAKLDVIFVVEHGKIVESGSHNDLIARDGAYAQLDWKQFREREAEPATA